jgi:hypothetical protein
MIETRFKQNWNSRELGLPDAQRYHPSAVSRRHLSPVGLRRAPVVVPPCSSGIRAAQPEPQSIFERQLPLRTSRIWEPRASLKLSVATRTE